MSRKLFSAIAAVYVFLSIVLGGSAQGIWGNLALQLLGISLLSLTAFSAQVERSEGPSKVPFALLIIGLCVIALQLVPLPASIWTHLPGRDLIAQGLNILEYADRSAAISYAPYNSIMTLFEVVPAIVIFIALTKIVVAPRWIALAILTGTTLSIFVGAVQVAGGRDSWAYLYRITNAGAVGFFANQNHMATLLLVSIPMAAAMLGSAKVGLKTATGRYAIEFPLLILLLVGIALNGSLAAFGLAAPVIIASVSLIPAAARWRPVALPISIVALIAGAAFVASAPIGSEAFRNEASTSVASRASIWKTTEKAIADTFPLGTGLGSFEQVYRQFERPDQVTSEYVNHAHNDYLEFTLELGLPGLLLILVFLAWWIVAAVRIWRSHVSTPFGRAATIGTAVILIHSSVDFPLRTASISVIFGASLAIMVRQLHDEQILGVGNLSRSRHVKLG